MTTNYYPTSAASFISTELTSMTCFPCNFTASAWCHWTHQRARQAAVSSEIKLLNAHKPLAAEEHIFSPRGLVETKTE